MNKEDATKLLRDAGVPEEAINDQAIMIASVLGEAIAREAARVLAEKFVGQYVTARSAHQRPDGAVDYQFVDCKRCGYIELRFNQVPRTACPKCDTPIEEEWPSEIVEGGA